MKNSYKPKDLNFGIIILCPNLNIGHLKNTINSVNVQYPDTKTIVVLPENCDKDTMDTVSRLKKTYKAGRTVASAINCGLKHSPCTDWNFILIAKGWLRNKVDIKYSHFIEDKTDILFSVTSLKKFNFVEENTNLLVINQQAFKNIGEFPDIDNLEISKLIWATRAIQKGYKFKGIVGGKCF